MGGLMSNARLGRTLLFVQPTQGPVKKYEYESGRRDQRKYQFRYDVARTGGTHAIKFGANFIYEPKLSGRLADDAETLVRFPEDPTFSG